MKFRKVQTDRIGITSRQARNGQDYVITLKFALINRFGAGLVTPLVSIACVTTLFTTFVANP